MGATLLKRIAGKVFHSTHTEITRSCFKGRGKELTDGLFVPGSRLLQSVRRVWGIKPKGLVVVYNIKHLPLTGIMVPIAWQLLQNGYGVCFAEADTIIPPKTGISAFDRLNGSVSKGGGKFENDAEPKRHQDWVVNWRERVVSCGGVNYFSYFHERIAQKLRRYSADIDGDPDARSLFNELLTMSDVTLTFCERLATAAKGKPTRIAIMDSHFAPWGIIREWCARVGMEKNIHAVALSAAYENYFSNLGTHVASSLSVENMTAQPNVRAPFLGGARRFEQYLVSHPETLSFDPEVLAWVAQNRSRSDPSSEMTKAIGSSISAAKSSGGKVFVALGKVTVDFAAPGDSGLAHSDFVHWINDLIEKVVGTKNLLLIKPHPHELRAEIVGSGVQMLRDLVPAKLPENVVFLPHDAYSTHEVAPLADAAFVWNGTASVEFPVLGVPVFQASKWGIMDYPINGPKLLTSEAYREVLSGGTIPTFDEETRKRAFAFIRFMQSDDVAIPYRYVRRAAVNQSVGKNVLYPEDIERLTRHGDPYVAKAASRFFEAIPEYGAA